MSETNPTPGLEVLEPPTATIRLAGREATIRPLGLYQIPAFARAIQPLLPGLVAAIGESGDVNPLIVADLLAEHGEELIEAMRLALGRTKAEMQEVGADEFLEAIPAVLAINRDFFTRRLIPAMQRAAAAAAAGRGTGPTPSRD